MGVNVTVRPTKQETPSTGTREDIALVNESLLKNRIENITNRFRISIDDQLLEFINLALQERLRNVAEELVSISKKRTLDVSDSCFSFAMTSDTKNALREIEKREKEIAQRKSADEKQRLLEAAKANKKDKKDNKVLQDKWNKLVEEDEAQRTNDTALMAIGNVRIKKPQRSDTKSDYTSLAGSPLPSSPATSSVGVS